MLGFLKKTVYVIGEHELVRGHAPRGKEYFRCKRCRKRRNEKTEFHDLECHNCDCGRCDI